MPLLQDALLDVSPLGAHGLHLAARSSPALQCLDLEGRRLLLLTPVCAWNGCTRTHAVLAQRRNGLFVPFPDLTAAHMCLDFQSRRFHLLLLQFHASFVHHR